MGGVVRGRHVLRDRVLSNRCRIAACLTFAWRSVAMRLAVNGVVAYDNCSGMSLRSSRMHSFPKLCGEHLPPNTCRYRRRLQVMHPHAGSCSSCHRSTSTCCQTPARDPSTPSLHTCRSTYAYPAQSHITHSEFTSAATFIRRSSPSNDDHVQPNYKAKTATRQSVALFPRRNFDERIF